MSLHSDLLHIGEKLKNVYGTSCKLRGMSWRRNGEEVRL
jgi:hypothetical protein